MRAIAIALGLLCGVARADGLVEPLPAAAYELNNTIDKQVVQVPLVLEADAALTTVQTLAVTVGSDAKPDLIDSFEPAIGNHGLEVTINVGNLDAVTYVVELAVQGTVSTKPATQLLHISFDLHPAQLRAIPAIVVDTAHFWPWEGSRPVVEIPLANLSKKTRITQLVVEQDGLNTNGTAQTQARLVARDLKGELAPSGRQVVKLSGDDFALGSTLGALVISGRQLDPVAVQFEVRTRLYSVWIVIAFAAFGFLGWFMRLYLKNREALAQFNAQAAPLIARFEADSATFLHVDRVLLEAKVAAMRDALASRDVTKAQVAADELSAALGAAIASRDAKLAEQQTDVDTLRRAIVVGWRLPKLPSEADVKVAADAVEKRDPTTADDKLLGLVTPIGAAMEDWLDKASVAIADPVFQSAATLAKVKQAVDAVPASVTSGPYGPYLAAANQARSTMRSLVAMTAAPLLAVARSSLETARANNVPVLPELERAVEFAPSDNPELDVVRLKELAKLAHVAPLPNLENPANEALIAIVATPDHGISARRLPPVSSPPVQTVAIARARLVEIQVLRGIMSASVLSVIAWVAFRSTWVGTVEDFVKVAVLAFFSDFTLDAVLQALGKLKPATT